MSVSSLAPALLQHADLLNPRMRMAGMQALTAILYDFDALNPDDEIGRVSIPVRDLPHEQKQDLWLDVFDYAADHEANKFEVSISSQPQKQ